MANLHSRQQRAIIALLKCRTVASACKQSNVPRRTMENWLRDSDFLKALREARQKMFNIALGRLCLAANRAASILIDGVKGKPITHMQRLCARDILVFAQGGITDDILARMDEFENRMKAFAEGIGE